MDPSDRVGRSPSAPMKKELTHEAASRPIRVLDNNLARFYSHIHPVLILGALIAIFPQLIARPVYTLAWTAVPLSLLQTTYSAICLAPSAGSSTPQPQNVRRPGRRRVGIAKDGLRNRSRALTSAMALFLTLTLTMPCITILIMLGGGPILSHGWETILCATHMGILCFMPLFYVYGVDALMWKEIAAAYLPFDAVWGGSLGALVGAWLGAIPIPLDWDRPWQSWPITIVVGSYLGWFVFRLLGMSVLYGKRVDLLAREPGGVSIEEEIARESKAESESEKIAKSEIKTE